MLTPMRPDFLTAAPISSQKNIASKPQPDWDLKVVSAIHRVLNQGSDLSTVVPMVLAGPTYNIGKAAVLRSLLARQGATWLSRGLSLKFTPVLMGFGLETSLFSTASRGLSHLLGRPVEWNPTSIARDWAMAGMTLGLLKSAAFAGRAGTQWWRGLDEFQPQLWTKADHRALFWAGQTSAYFGLVGSHALQAKIYPELQSAGGNIWLDSLGTHLALGLGAYSGRSFLGARFQAMEQQLAAQAHRLYLATKPQFNFPGGTFGPVAEAAGGARIPFDGQPVHPGKSENIVKMAQHSDQGFEGTPSERSGPTSSLRNDWDIARPVSWVGDFRAEGEQFVTQGKLDPAVIKKYGDVTGNEVITHSGYAPGTLPFLAGFPVMFDSFLSHMLANRSTSVIHVNESSVFHQPIRSDAELKIQVTTKVSGKAGKRQIAKVKTEIFDSLAPEGEKLLAEGNTTLLIQTSAPGAETKVSNGAPLSSEDLGKLPKQPAMIHRITSEEINDYAQASGDYNPIHMLDEMAQGRGLPGRIAHGMLIQGLATRALFFADTQRNPSQPPRLSTDFKGIVRPGDTLKFFVEPFEVKETNERGKTKVVQAGNRVTVLNQQNQMVLQMVDETPGEQARRVQENNHVKYIYRKIEYADGKQKVTYRGIPIDAQAGIYRVKRLAEQMEPEIAKLRELPLLPDQPNVLLGVSSGYGLHDAITALSSGDMRRGVGVFFEPLPLIMAGRPLMINSLENVEGLRFLAENKGIDFPIFYADGVLVQKEGGVHRINPAVIETIKRQQAVAEIPDIYALNAIAFSTHISPLPGVKTTPFIPSLNLEKKGQLEFIKLKEADPVKGMGTLNPMGYNHRALLEGLREFFGPHSLSLVATWAGGSQNIEILRGIYGDGYLGRAKQIAEEGALDFHLKSREQGYALGHHKVVRLPSFNSRALWAIPGGSIFGLLSHGVMELYSTPDYSLNQDLTRLAPRVRYKIRNGSHVRENPLSQIELDSAENTYIEEINRHRKLVYRRIAEAMPKYEETYEKVHGIRWDGETFDLNLLQKIPNFAEAFQEKHGYKFEPITLPDGSIRFFNLETTRLILKDLVSENWEELVPAPETAPK